MGERPEKVVDLDESWKFKHVVNGSQSELDNYQRIFVPASNIDRNEEDGCMKKIKMERSLKLRQEDLRDQTYNVLTNNQLQENNWLGCFGD